MQMTTNAVAGTTVGGPRPADPVRRIRPVHRGGERAFYGGMTLLMIGTILLGFRATYFPLGAKPAALSSFPVALHGIVYSLYLALFLVQVSLIAARRVRWHMSIGLAIYCLAALMIPLGVLAAADEIKRDLATGPPYLLGIDPRSFSLVSVMGTVMFGTLIGWSYVVRRNPQMHKRLALYATLSMMNAGSDRWPWQAWGIDEGWSVWVYTGLLLLPVLYDLISMRRLHRATIIAAPYVWILYKVQIPLGRTRAWHYVADFMLRHLT
jgi:hypothetical protein